jgi:hypothetical protein
MADDRNNPVSGIGAVEAQNKELNAVLNNTGVKRPVNLQLGLTKFDDEDLAKQVKTADDNQITKPGNYNYVEAQETWALRRDLRYTNASRRFLYAQGVANKQKQQYVGTLVSRVNNGGLVSA